MIRRRTIAVAGTLVAAFAALGIGQRALVAKARLQTVQAPRFEVDPMWPKPLPNHWVLGSTIGRYIFSLYIPKVSNKIIKPRKNDELEFVGKNLGAKLWRAS